MENHKIIWFSISEYVDIDTGEVLDKKMATSKQYIIIKKTKKHEVNNTTGTVYIINECRKSGQIELF